MKKKKIKNRVYDPIRAKQLREQKKCIHEWTSMVNCVLTSKCTKCGLEDTSF